MRGAATTAFSTSKLKLTASAKRNGETAFHVEVVTLACSSHERSQELIEPLLLIECPRFLFPYSRRLISDLVTEGGFPPLHLDPIDFAAVYARAAAADGTAAGRTGVSANIPPLYGEGGEGRSPEPGGEVCRTHTRR